jgi:hypothetical protein
MTTNYPPPRFRVLPPSDPYAGRVGTLVRLISDHGGLVYVVQFVGKRGDHPLLSKPTAYYRRQELAVQ